MKTIALLLCVPLLACSQIPINLKPPVSQATKLPNHMIENFTIPAGAVGASTFTFILAKLPIPGATVDVRFSGTNGQIVQAGHPDPTQSATLQKTVVITLLGGAVFAVGDGGQILYDTFDPVP